MTPTTITRADELADLLGTVFAFIKFETDQWNPSFINHIATALAAYRAARSTDGACDDTARLDWMDSAQASIVRDSKYAPVCGHAKTLNWITGKTVRAAIDAARAASGSGEG